MSRRSLVTLATLTLLTLGCLQQRAHATSMHTVDKASAQEIVDGMATKLSRGIANTATGWGEFPKQIYVTWNEDGPTRGILIGPLKGIGMTIARTLSGVGEVATFFIAWPGFFDPYIDPPFVWQKE
ncbi:MAG: exosortase system-associated protein, TIGR04073 family [Desulfuromonadales bacterium]|nr:MAG: exosortase system-associated protein, TIGR04073 family [Desulfuromonadales bacterium]